MQLSHLKKPCKMITLADIEQKDTIVSTLASMNKYIQDNKLRGIAANQLGSSFRMLCYVGKDNVILNCINPVIEKTHSKVRVIEEDPSFPGYVAKVERFNKLKVKYLSVSGNLKEEKVTLRNQEAFIFQKCLDLLNGITIFDKGLPEYWFSKYPKVYEVAYLQDYFTQGENKLWFGGTVIDPENITVTRIAGIKITENLKLIGGITMRTKEEIKDLLESEYGNNLLTDSQKEIIQDEKTEDIYNPEYKGDVPEEETDRNAIKWLYKRISTEELLGLDIDETEVLKDAKPVTDEPPAFIAECMEGDIQDGASVEENKRKTEEKFNKKNREGGGAGIW